MDLKKAFIHLILSIAILTSCGCFSKNRELSQEEIQELVDFRVEEANEITAGGEPFRAIEILDKLLAQYPQNTKILEAIAFTYLDAKDPGLAAFYFEQILMLDQDMMEYRIFAAQAYSDAQEWNEAIRNYLLYLEAFPSDKGTWLAITACYEANKNYKDAVNAFLKAHKLTNTHPNDQACVKIAQLYQHERDLDQMKEWLYKALKENPKNQEALKVLLKLEVGSENYPLAEKHLKALSQLDLTSVDAHFISAAREKINVWREELTLKETQERELKELQRAQEERMFADNLGSEAIEEMEVIPVTEEVDDIFKKSDQVAIKNITETPRKPESSISNIAPTNAKDHFQFAQNAIAQNNYPEAIKHYWDAVMENPNPAEYWFELAQALSNTKDYSNAEMTMLEAVRRKPNDVGYQISYLKLIEQQGANHRWIEELKKAYDKFPNNPDIMFTLAKGYDHINHSHFNAKQLYKKFLQIAPYHPDREYARARLASL